ncbi:hypothetical protein BH09BAC4_BH09BAC4_49310 [soil metagenome]
MSSLMLKLLAQVVIFRAFLNDGSVQLMFTTY